MNILLAMFDGGALVRGLLYGLTLFVLILSPVFAWCAVKVFKVLKMRRETIGLRSNQSKKEKKFDY